MPGPTAHERSEQEAPGPNSPHIRSYRLGDRKPKSEKNHGARRGSGRPRRLIARPGRGGWTRPKRQRRSRGHYWPARAILAQ